MMSRVRITINLDDEVYQTVRTIAHTERRALGAVVSDLVRRGLVPPQVHIDDEDGFPVFHVAGSAQPISDEMVRAVLGDG